MVTREIREITSTQFSTNVLHYCFENDETVAAAAQLVMDMVLELQQTFWIVLEALLLYMFW